MSESIDKYFNVRIKLRIDSHSNWNKKENFIPYKGEIIIYDILKKEEAILLNKEPINYQLIKIGDGITLLQDLPFINQFNNAGITVETGLKKGAFNFNGKDIYINGLTPIEQDKIMAFALKDQYYTAQYIDNTFMTSKDINNIFEEIKEEISNYLPYKAGSGIKIDNDTISHINVIEKKESYNQSNVELNYGDSFKIFESTHDSQGHITGTQFSTITLPIKQEIPESLKNPESLIIGNKQYDGSKEISIKAEDLGLSNALHFIGVVDEQLPTSANNGDVVLFGDKEYLYNNGWIELGDSTSYAFKDIKIKAGEGLTGGGDLTKDITISHADTSSVQSILTENQKYISGLTFDNYGHVIKADINEETIYSFEEGDNNGQIKVKISSGQEYNVNVHGLTTNAFTNEQFLPLNITNEVYLQDEQNNKYNVLDNLNKIADIEENANNYILPVATKDVLGGIKSGGTGDITVTEDGYILVNNNSHNHIIENITDFEEKVAPFATKEYVDEKIKNLSLELPEYWEQYLEDKVEEIYEALKLTGENKSSFLWYHDSHWTYSHKVSPMILSYLNKNTPINKTNFGGDIVDAESLDPNEMNYLYEWRSLIKQIPNHHSVPGNHDDGNTSNNIFSNEYIYSFLLAAEETPDIIRDGNGLYYYIDNTNEKTRYLYLDTATSNGNIAWNEKQQVWLKKALLTVPEQWHVIAIAHTWRDVDYSVTPHKDAGFSVAGKWCLDLFDKFNNREDDFINSSGQVEFVIGGHTHIDGDFTSEDGIPVILTEADSCYVRGNYQCIEGTTSEASVNVIIADYNNRKINVIRIGRGESRVVQLSENILGEKTYTNILQSKDIGWKENARYSESNNEDVEVEGWDITGYIPVKAYDVIRLKNVIWKKTLEGRNEYRGTIDLFTTDKEHSARGMTNSEGTISWFKVILDSNSNDIIQFTIPKESEEQSAYAYVRICCQDINENSIITVNEDIVETETENNKLNVSMKFGGVVTSLPRTSTVGTVVLMNDKEYIYDISKGWVEFGDEKNYIDTKVTQTISTIDGTFPILLRGTSAGVETITSTTSFAQGVTVNPFSGLISATKFIGNLNVNYLYQANGDELILECND